MPDITGPRALAGASAPNPGDGIPENLKALHASNVTDELGGSGGKSPDVIKIFHNDGEKAAMAALRPVLDRDIISFFVKNSANEVFFIVPELGDQMTSIRLKDRYAIELDSPVFTLYGANEFRARSRFSSVLESLHFYPGDKITIQVDGQTQPTTIELKA